MCRGQSTKRVMCRGQSARQALVDARRCEQADPELRLRRCGPALETTARSRRAPAARARPLPPRSWAWLFSSIGHDTSLFFRLVLVCIETKFCIQMRILQHFSKSTKLSGWIFKIRFLEKIYLKIGKISDFHEKICNFLQNLNPENSTKNCKITRKSVLERCKGWSDNLVDLEKCWKMCLLSLS